MGSSEAQTALQRCPELRQGCCAFVLSPFWVWVAPREGGMALDKASTFSQGEYPWGNSGPWLLPAAEGISVLVLKGGTWTVHHSLQYTASALLTFHITLLTPCPCFGHSLQEAPNSQPPLITWTLIPIQLCISPNLMPCLPQLSKFLSPLEFMVSISKISSILKCSLNIPSSLWPKFLKS